MSKVESDSELSGEQKMQQRFEEEVDKVLERKDEYRKNDDITRVGLETEYAVVDGQLEPISTARRDEIIEDIDFADVEVGGSQIETRTEPMDLSSLSDLEQELLEAERQLKQKVSKDGAQLIRSGTNPFVTAEDMPRSEEEKYQTVPDFHDERRGDHVRDSFGRKETVDPRNADMAALINSTQINIEADSLEDAVDKANYTHMISPFLSAISGNARFLERKDTGFSDVRNPLWEISHDIREDPSEEELKMGGLERYHESIEDYFQKIGEDPFILTGEDPQEEPIGVAAGTYWKDAKIKLERYEKSAVVESRAVSTQPTAEEDIAMHGFFLGRLAHAQHHDEGLMEIRKVNRNRYAAMFGGTDTKLYGSDGELAEAGEVIEEELDKAREGLEYLDLEGDRLDILYDRVENGLPSEDMATAYEDARSESESRRKAILAGLESKGGFV